MLERVGTPNSLYVNVLDKKAKKIIMDPEFPADNCLSRLAKVKLV